MEKEQIKNFLDQNGRLKQFPAKQKMKQYVLEYLAEKFAENRSYTEKEVNELLDEWHTFHDPATLRRELYNHHYIDREENGGVYWREEK